MCTILVTPKIQLANRPYVSFNGHFNLGRHFLNLPVLFSNESTSIFKLLPLPYYLMLPLIKANILLYLIIN
jgi:hypothetical protein